MIANSNFRFDPHQELLDDPSPKDYVHSHQETQNHPQNDPHVLSNIFLHQGDIAEPNPYQQENTPANQQNPELLFIFTYLLSYFLPIQTSTPHFLFAIYLNFADLALLLIPAFSFWLSSMWLDIVRAHISHCLHIDRETTKYSPIGPVQSRSCIIVWSFLYRVGWGTPPCPLIPAFLPI